VTATNAQVRILMQERRKGRTQGQAAAKANLRSRKAAARYETTGKLPSELKKERMYATRIDVFKEDWDLVERKLEDAQSLEAKALFEWLCDERPGKYQETQLRTFQRRVERWKTANGERTLSLPQVRHPGVLMQADGTSMNELRVTLDGEEFPHILIHAVLPYSNWEWGRVAQSESLLAVELGIGSAVEALGHVPLSVQTDPSSAATHRLSAADRAEGDGKRGFNARYVAFLDRLGIKPVSTHVASPDENGDVEASNGALKRSIEQHLLLRGSRDFEDVDAYENFLFKVMRRRNTRRQMRLNEELAVMKPLKMTVQLPIREIRARVCEAGTARVMNRPYSLPSGLKGHTVKAIVSEWQVEFWYGGRCVRCAPRLPGDRSPCIDYRHVISTLLRKPGGFRNYRYREAMFPRPVFGATWEALKCWLPPRRADLAYLRVLKLAATTLESDVAAALEQLLQAGEPFDDETVRVLVTPPSGEVPTVERGTIDLHAYDRLLMTGANA